MLTKNLNGIIKILDISSEQETRESLIILAEFWGGFPRLKNYYDFTSCILYLQREFIFSLGEQFNGHLGYVKIVLTDGCMEIRSPTALYVQDCVPWVQSMLSGHLIFCLWRTQRHEIGIILFGFQKYLALRS